MLICFKDEHRKFASPTVILKSIDRQRRMTPAFFGITFNLSININFYRSLYWFNTYDLNLEFHLFIFQLHQIFDDRLFSKNYLFYFEGIIISNIFQHEICFDNNVFYDTQFNRKQSN